METRTTTERRQAVVVACRAGAHRAATKPERQRLTGQEVGGAVPRGTYADVERAYQAWVGRRTVPRPPTGQPMAKRWPAIRRARVAAAVGEAYDRCGYRVATRSNWVEGSGHITRVDVGDTLPHSVACSADTVWAGGGKCRSGTASRHVIHVPSDWRSAVDAVGIAVVDGLLTLDARPAGDGAYAARWVEQSRGTALRVVDGYLARASAIAPWAHGATAVSARRTSAARLRAMVSEVEDLDCSADQRLSLADALHAAEAGTLGACAAGVRDWCERHLPGRTEATVGEVLQAAITSGDRSALARLVVRRLVARRVAA